MASLFLLPPPHMKVIVRVRPMLPTESKKSPATCVEIAAASPSNHESQIQIDEQVFDVDRVYDDRLNQRDFFVKEFSHVIPSVFDGTNVTVFACGTPSAGKTYTMEGASKNPGVTARAMQKLFQYGQQQVADFRVEMVLVEVCQSKVIDCLVSKNHQEELSVRNAPNGRVLVDGVVRKHIRSYTEFHTAYDRACKQRRKGASAFYARSSRSHLVVQLRINSRGFDGSVHESQFDLIDLAGHDDICPSVQESASMMLDLQPLAGNAISRLLTDSVAHSDMAVMVCAISPARVVVKETLQMLQYAAKKKHAVSPVPVVVNMQAVELTPKAKPAATPTLETTTPWSKRRRVVLKSANKIVPPMKKLKLQGSTTGAPVVVVPRPIRLKPFAGSRVVPGRAFLSQPIETASIKHLLTMAVDFEKRGKGRAAVALYKHAHGLLPQANEKLAARIRALEENASPLTSPTAGSSPRPMHAHVQHILEADILDTLNHGSPEALLELSGIGEKKAAKILKGRDHVVYTSVRDLAKVGMGEKQVIRFQHLNITSRLTPL
ncbi:Aste57867_24273 [Aphanomyces stellatus]|uniref:Aste57867_24273 protein n=1 Tax=Aphanomyces stellatus TaxID=120398 RepID=A0A485LR36_9STRA|nr:hypothetical protein As57867_024198 [Aphanomyces stellatus]VFU00913.1 Aste57867_24273 [Aphanomyces stellatus]